MTNRETLWLLQYLDQTHGSCLMRYLPLSDTDRGDMLARVGVNSIDDLFADIPEDVRLQDLLDLPKRASEMEVERKLSAMAAKNTSAGSVPFFVGAGAYKHHVPATVDHLIQRSEFLTSYTPYQPEITQGTLQYLFEFQTQVARLTAMDVANASMYDGSTGTGEAVLMAHRITKRNKAVLSGGLHPQYRDVVEGLSSMAGDRVVSLPADPHGTEDILSQIDDETSCVVVQSPSFYGQLIDLKPIAEKAHQHKALLIAVFTEVVSLGLIEPPGTQGADIVVGEGQSIGNGLNYGGPYVGLFATRQKYVRQMPGRLCGETVDAEGKRGFVLTSIDQGTAYPPRQGDVQYLHQLRPVLSGLHHPHVAAGAGRFDKTCPHQPWQRRQAEEAPERSAGC